ncbi:MAG: hypothetical protein S0880_36295 [Actinomycetota bacterium]|nr:hypothetical protein [Actinomycetota bacterium]
MIDAVMFLAGAAAGGIDAESALAASPLSRRVAPPDIDAVLAAHAGFCAAGALEDVEPGLEAIPAAKQELAVAALSWLRRRLA